MKKSVRLLLRILSVSIMVIILGTLIPFNLSLDAKTGDDDEKHPIPSAFLDPVEDSVDIDDKKAIYKLLKAYKEKVEKDGIESIELPFSESSEKDEDDEEQVEEEKEDNENSTGSEEYEELEEPEFFFTIPTVGEKTACVIRSNGIVQGNFFLTTYFDYECSNIQVWRLTFDSKDTSKKDRKEWQITGKKIKNVLTNLHHLNFKPDKIYSFDSFQFSHDRIKVKYESGHFVTLFAGDIPIGGIIIGKGGFYYDPPRQLAIDDKDSDVEEYQLMRFTGVKDDRKYYGGKTKLDNEPFENGFIMMHPDRFEEYIKLDQFRKVEGDAGVFGFIENVKKLFDEYFKGSCKFPSVKKKKFALIPGDDEIDMFSCAVNAKKYDWIYYDLSPLGIESAGIRNEIFLSNKFKYLVSAHEGGSVFGMFDTEEQRNTMTRKQLEHDSKEKVMITNETVVCKIREKKTDLANVKSKVNMSIMQNKVENLTFNLYNNMKLTAVTNSDGFALPFCRSGLTITVFPLKRLKKGNFKELTFYNNGQIAYTMARGTLHNHPSMISPFTGYLQCMTLDLLVKTPKPLLALSVGELVEEWEEDDYNVTYWKSEECIRFWSIIYGEYEKFTMILELPEGDIPFSLYYNPSEFRVRMANKKRIVDETESVMKWLEALYGKYPYPKMSIAQKSILSGYSQGFPSMLQLSGFTFISDMVAERAYLTGFVGTWDQYGPAHVAHEAGHQWWGNIVGWARSNDQWLSEGITEQQAPNYMQARDRDDVKLKDTLDTWRANALEDDREGPIALGIQRLGYEPYLHLTYSKAPYVMNMLRMIVGEETFIKICRQFIDVFGFKRGPTTCDFVEIVCRTLGEEYCMERFGEKNMCWFFDQWIYNRGIPEFAFAYEPYKDGRDWKAKCRIRMLNGVLFKIPARIAVYDSKGKDPYFVEVLLQPKEVQEFVIDLKRQPDKIFFNRFDAVLSRGTTNEKM